MEPPTPKVSDANLHGYIDAELEVSGLLSPKDEQKLTVALSHQEGLRELSIANGKVRLEYDPALICVSKLTEMINAAGFQVARAESSSASPILDAITSEESSEI